MFVRFALHNDTNVIINYSPLLHYTFMNEALVYYVCIASVSKDVCVILTDFALHS